jgi:hypothetical protein
MNPSAPGSDERVAACSIGSCHRHQKCMYTPCRTAAPMTPSGQTPGDGEWIEWAGGECPLPKGAAHEVRLRNGTIEWDDEPETWRWRHRNNSTDIIAYRVVQS